MTLQLKTVPMGNYIGEYINDFLNEYKKKSQSSYLNYRSSLNKIFKEILGKTEFLHVTSEDIEKLSVQLLRDYFNEMHEEVTLDDEPKYKAATINRHMSVIKELIKYLSAWDIIEYNVEKLYLIKSLPDTRQEHEMIPFDLAMKYVEYFSKEDKGLEKSLIIKLAIETGLRATELLSLTWSNFVTENDSDGVVMRSNGNNKGKGNKEWNDKISKDLYNELLQLKEIGNTDKLFNLSYKYLDGMMKRGNEILNNTDKKYTFHSFKKLAVTMTYLNAGNCIDTAMKKARHSNVNTTMRYLRLTNMNITGIISANMNTEEDMYKKVSHEDLLEALSEMRSDMLLLLNNKLKNKKG